MTLADGRTERFVTEARIAMRKPLELLAWRPGPHSERGAALLVVMVAVAVLTALAVDLAYESARVAPNRRERARRAARLVPRAERRRDVAPGALVPAAARRRPSPAGRAGRRGGAALPALEARPDRRGARATALFGGGGRRRSRRAAPLRRRARLLVRGELEDEGRKVNAQLEGSRRRGDRKLVAAGAGALPARLRPPLGPALRPRGRARRPDHARGPPRAPARLGGRGRALLRAPRGVRRRPPARWCRRSRRSRTPSGTRTSRTIGARTATGRRTRGWTRSTSCTSWPASATPSWPRSATQLTVYLPRDAQRNVNELDRTQARRAREGHRGARPGSRLLLDPAFADRLQKAIVRAHVRRHPVDHPEAVRGDRPGVRRHRRTRTWSRTGQQPVHRPLDHVPHPGHRHRGRRAVVDRRGGAARDARSRASRSPAPGRLIHWREE